MARIAQLMLRETAERMRTKNMEMALTPSAMAKLLEIGFDKEYGARPPGGGRVAVVDDGLSEALLRGAIEEGDTAVIDYDPGYADGPDPVSARGGFVSPVSAMTRSRERATGKRVPRRLRDGRRRRPRERRDRNRVLQLRRRLLRGG